MDEKCGRDGTSGCHRGADCRVLVVSNEIHRNQKYHVDRSLRPVVFDRSHSEFCGHRRSHQVPLHAEVRGCLLFLNRYTYL